MQPAGPRNLATPVPGDRHFAGPGPRVGLWGADSGKEDVLFCEGRQERCCRLEAELTAGVDLSWTLMDLDRDHPGSQEPGSSLGSSVLWEDRSWHSQGPAQWRGRCVSAAIAFLCFCCHMITPRDSSACLKDWALSSREKQFLPICS